MKKVAVFGNAGGGKSTLSRKLAEISNLPLHVLDKIQYLPGGIPLEQQEFLQAHQQILESDTWIIDGFGSPQTLWPRLEAADTLIYIDLPLLTHFLLVCKRLVTGLFQNPQGWPENSPIWKSSWTSYQILLPCHRLLTPRYREFVQKSQETKTVYHLKSLRDCTLFLTSLEN